MTCQDDPANRLFALQEALRQRDLEVAAARAAEAESAERLRALTSVALELASAETVSDLITALTEGGLAVVGSPGGAVAVRDGDLLRSVVSDDLGGASTQEAYGLLPVSGPLPVSVASRTGEPVLLPDLAACLAFAPEMRAVVDATGAQAFASLPLRTTAHDIGVLTVAWAQPRAFDDLEVSVLIAFAAQISQALDRLQTRAAERSAMTALAGTVEAMQRSLLTDPPPSDGSQIAVRYLPAARQAQVGGDWYDSFPLPDGRTVLVIGDVAGHDAQAAAAMAQVRNVLRGVAHHGGGAPAAILTALDTAMQDLPIRTLATAVVATLESRPAGGGPERLLRWSNAGHPAPLLLHRDGTVEVLERRTDLLLGVDPGRPRGDHSHLLEPGATVFFYTDGLTERRGASLDAGTDWLVETLAHAPDGPLDQLCDHVLGHLDDWVDDDIAVLALRISEQS